MDFKTFLENFDAIAEAPGGIPKLRSLILDLAVRGKLMSQNPEDEPAQELLSRLAAMRKELVHKGLKGLPATTSSISDDIDELPSGWQWVKVGNLTQKLGSGSTPKGGKQVYVSSGIKFIRSQNVRNNGLLLEDVAYISPDIHQKMNNTVVQPGDVLLNITGASIGRSALVPTDFDEANVSQHVAIVRPIMLEMNQWIHLYLISPMTFRNIMDVQVGISREGLSMIRLKEFLIPLPPLAEQKRIVEKVDELMALCDRYEAAKQTRDNLRQKLRESAIASLMDAETDKELEVAWAFVRDNWHNLSQQPEDINSLRQTLLHLAVRGKLVFQNPNDEPAEKLLKIIATKHTTDAKKFRKPKDLPSLKDLDKPFELPLGWSWCRFTEIGQLDRGKSKHRPRNDSVLYENGFIPLVQTGDVARANGVIETYTALYNHQGLAQSRLWSKGTLCITIAANIGDSAILGFDACFPDSIVGFLPTEPISDSRYFEFFIRTLKSRLEDFAPSTAQKNINLGILDEVLIPLPPLAEQKRILAKVDELMKLCDQLEASLRQSQQRAESLAASAISHLTI